MAHSPFVVHWEQGSLTLPLPASTAETLDQDLTSLLQAWQGSPPQPVWERIMPLIPNEITLEVFCNPNIWVAAHAARLLLTLKTTQIKVSVEVMLTQFHEDLTLFRESLS
jgi:hypothetical protein